MHIPQVSIIIRTFNEERHIGLLLDTLKSQLFDHQQIEIIVVDSGSTDQTLEIVKDHDVNLVKLTQESFTYSKALNLGVETSRGKWIVILSAHAIPSSQNWLSGMISHFDDEQVAGAYCRQVPWPDAPWDEKMRIEKTFPSESCVFSAENKNDDLHFSNAASCIPKKLWQIQPFVDIPAAEDRVWALWAIHTQHKNIVYDASISVCHSHNEPPRRAANRLIEISKAIDIDKKRKRTILLTLRNALSMWLKDCTRIFQYEGCKGKRCISMSHSFCRAFWFFWDF